MEIRYREPEDERTERRIATPKRRAGWCRRGVGVAVVSTFGLLVLVFGLLIATGSVGFSAPLDGSPVGFVFAITFVVPVLALAVVSIWSWEGR